MVLTAWLGAVAVLVALAVDRWLGEPPARWHPVVWMVDAGKLWVMKRVKAIKCMKFQ